MVSNQRRIQRRRRQPRRPIRVMDLPPVEPHMAKEGRATPCVPRNGMKERTHWIYLIHFDRSLHHARHYLGATRNLHQRLEQHAHGRGARLTQEIVDLGIGWQLAAVWITNKLWTSEQHAKRQKHGPKYCPLCNPTTQKTIEYAISYPLVQLPASLFKRKEPRNV